MNNILAYIFGLIACLMGIGMGYKLGKRYAFEQQNVNGKKGEQK